MASLLACTTPASSLVTEANWERCENKAEAYSSDQEIEGCTAIIEDTGSRDLTVALANRALAYHQSGDLLRAMADYNEAIRLDPRRAGPFNGRGLIFEQQGEISRAIEDFDQAIRLNPQFVEAYSNRAAARLAAGGDAATAMADFNEAVRLNPQRAALVLNRGMAYAATGDLPRAMTDLNDAIRLDPTDPLAFHVRGLTNRDLGNYRQAIADYGEALRLRPNDPATLNERCWARGLWGQELDQALADCSTALTLQPNAANILNSRAFVRLKRGDYQAAFDDYNASVHANSESADSLFGRGIARIRLGQNIAGEADLAAALARDAGIERTYEGRGVRR